MVETFDTLIRVNYIFNTFTYTLIFYYVDMLMHVISFFKDVWKGVPIN
jgi:hypothetical protein